MFSNCIDRVAHQKKKKNGNIFKKNKQINKYWE